MASREKQGLFSSCRKGNPDPFSETSILFWQGSGESGYLDSLRLTLTHLTS